jgi:F-type H+-transporting ATPase subunit b
MTLVVNVAPMIAVVYQAEHTETTVAGEGTTETHETGETGAETHAETAQVDNPILPVAQEVIWGGACFMLLWALMKFVLLKPIVSTMEERSARIQRDLEAAERARDEASAALAAHEASLASARVEASQIIDTARAEAEERRREILAAAEAQVAEQRTAANAEVAQAKAQALDSMRSSVATIAVQAAELVVQKRLDEAAQRAIVEEYLNRTSQN